MLQTTNVWDELVPNIFRDHRFHKTSRRRYQVEINDARAGIVVAWKPIDYDNYALNCEDIGKLLFLLQDKSFHVGFIVLASINGNAEYVGHRDVEEVDKTLKSVPARTGAHGNYWLLRQDFLPLDAQSHIPF